MIIEKGDNELTHIFDKYYRQPKYDLNEQELNEYYKIHDKTYKYLGEAIILNQKEDKQIYNLEAKQCIE